jgi:hypothetical protein
MPNEKESNDRGSASQNAPSGQTGGDRRWEQVAELVEETPEAEGKIGRGAPDRDPKADDQTPERTVSSQIEKNIDKGMEKA